MQADDTKYEAFNLCADMLDAVEVVRGFDVAVAEPIAQVVKQAGKLLLTGEGSSRLLPAKHAIKLARQRGYNLQLHTEAGCQSQSYDLIDWAVLAASNSGRTAEVVQLFKQLESAGHDKRFSVAAFADSLLEQSANLSVVLGCGEEGAVAATKSVIEQALVVQAVIESAVDDKRLAGELSAVADVMHAALTAEVPAEITKRLVDTHVIFWAGPNDGVGEELTLKTNEITRKPSDFLEGTYAAHGIEEVMDEGEVLIWIDPIEDQEAKFEEVLVKGVGMHIIAISTRETRFPTIRVQDAGDYTGLVHMAAGWNLLVETGIALGVDLDKPVRARKVGNAFVGQTMARICTTLFAALALLFVTAAAHAGEALPELKGTWVAETINGKTPKAPAKLVMTFIDDARLASEVTGPDGKTTKVEIKYKATADGTITMIPAPEKNPDGEKGTWEVKAGKLHIASGDNTKMVLVKQK
eukprot:g12112.t1